MRPPSSALPGPLSGHVTMWLGPHAPQGGSQEILATETEPEVTPRAGFPPAYGAADGAQCHRSGHAELPREATETQKGLDGGEGGGSQ